MGNTLRYPSAFKQVGQGGGQLPVGDTEINLALRLAPPVMAVGGYCLFKRFEPAWGMVEPGNSLVQSPARKIGKQGLEPAEGVSGFISLLGSGANIMRAGVVDKNIHTPIVAFIIMQKWRVIFCRDDRQ